MGDGTHTYIDLSQSATYYNECNWSHLDEHGKLGTNLNEDWKPTTILFDKLLMNVEQTSHPCM